MDYFRTDSIDRKDCVNERLPSSQETRFFALHVRTARYLMQRLYVSSAVSLCKRHMTHP
jgi:hypothetical protein